MKNLALALLLLFLALAGLVLWQRTRPNSPAVRKTRAAGTQSTAADTTPPHIANLAWTPVLVDEEKVGTGRVVFSVRDDSSALDSVEVFFTPCTYAELNAAAFPVETTRHLQLTPSGSRAESFSVEIDSIAGGREYDVTILVTDSAGNRDSATLTTPYLRQHPNRGARLARQGLVVSAVYEPFDFFTIPAGKEPLLGPYRPQDDIVQWKHIDWATGHGINLFWVDWTNWADSTLETTKPFADEIIRGLLDKGGLQIGVVLGAQRTMVYGGDGMPDWAINLNLPRNREILDRLARFVARRYVKHERYARAGDRPALLLYDERAFFHQRAAYAALRRQVRDATGANPFLIAMTIPPVPTAPDAEYFRYLQASYRDEGLALVDAFSGWIGFFDPTVENDSAAVIRYDAGAFEHMERWRKYALDRRKLFVPSVTPGFDNTHSTWGARGMPLPRSPERFRASLREALTATRGQERREVRIDTWNDFWESSGIEPSAKEGFVYLEILREELERECDGQ